MTASTPESTQAKRERSDEPVAKGLAGVVVDDTAISDVQAQGRLGYRGESIDSLVDLPVTRVAHRLIFNEDGDLDEAIRRHANLTSTESSWVLSLPAATHPMQVLAAAVPVLAAAGDFGLGDADQGLTIAAKLPAVVATHLKREPVEMDDGLGYAERFVRVVNPAATSAHEAAFNCAQVLQLDHGFNAGTFAARVVASTLAPIANAIGAGFGALSGPLHGGADQAIMDVVDGLASADDARAYVDDALARGDKIPGMGHREYRVRDPRAAHLERWAEQLAATDQRLASDLAVLRTMEAHFAERMREVGKPVHPNVEFYKGLVYRAVRLPNRFFTSGFAMARVFGYVAHFVESRGDNRIFRPAARYVGPPLTAGVSR